MNSLSAQCISWIFSKKKTVLLFFAALFALFGVSVVNSPPKEDITFFLPDNAQLQQQFQAFSLTPPARLIFIELLASSPEKAELFGEAAQKLRHALDPSLFTAVHPGRQLPEASALMGLIPSLMQPEDEAEFSATAQKAPLADRVLHLAARLMSHESIVLKHFIPHDPLGMLRILFTRFSQSNLLGTSGTGGAAGGLPALGALPMGEGLPSKDGLARLFFVETPNKGMDSAQAQQITEALEKIKKVMPQGISMQALSSHQHTAANVRAVQGDVARILIASSLALIVIFMIWLRSFSALPALALPGFALLGAWGILTLSGAQLSGITLGFGGVLLGIVDDYALHVHCAIAAGVAPKKVAKTLVKPLGFSFATTACAASVMFLSELPGMRQVGLFSLLGCAVGLALALFILPLLQKAKPPTKETLSCAMQTCEETTIAPLPYMAFLCCVALCLWIGKDISLQGDLRNLGVRDPVLVQAEKEIGSRWGSGFRQSALLVSTGASMDEALTLADAALQAVQPHLVSKGIEDQLISPLPLIPPPVKQDASRALWQRFVAQTGNELHRAFGPGGQAEAAGFAPQAFAPFLHQLDTPPDPITPGSLDAASMGLIRALFLPQWTSVSGSGAKEEKYAVLSFLPDDQTLQGNVQASVPQGTILFSPTMIAQQISQTVERDFAAMGAYSLLAVSICLFLALRSLQGFMLALVPPLAGSAALLLVFGLGKEPLNMFTVAALPLVIGLSAEYGIFMARHCAKEDCPSTPRAILLSGLTTLTGFGSLVLAVHPALHSLGVTVAVGIGAAIPASLWLLPRLAKKREFL